MSLTLGEKLRAAREERGFTISEIAEQTRISSLYLESIENDDYKILPGGIFNKGFVKSYAKFVGISEQEALMDYAALVADTEAGKEHELKLYKPEVLTDDRSSVSMIPTLIIAVVMLAAMTGGIFLLLRYLQQPADDRVLSNPPKANANTNDITATTPVETAPSNMPEMATLKVEFKAVGEPVSLTATSDGKMSSNVVPPGTTATFEPKDSLKLSYSKSLANTVQLTINGKIITLPGQPLVPRRNAIEFEITRENLAQIWTSGAISTDVPAAVTDVNANSDVNASGFTPPATIQSPPVRQATPKPSASANTAANTAVKPGPDAKAANAAKTPVTGPKPPTMPVANKP